MATSKLLTCMLDHKPDVLGQTSLNMNVLILGMEVKVISDLSLETSAYASWWPVVCFNNVNIN